MNKPERVLSDVPEVKETKSVTIQLPIDLYNSFKKDADGDDRTVSVFIVRYLKGYATGL